VTYYEGVLGVKGAVVCGKRAKRRMVRERVEKRHRLKHLGLLFCISDFELHLNGKRNSLKSFK
jgi:hypothetical protein